jgi:hypothetical protein
MDQECQRCGQPRPLTGSFEPTVFAIADDIKPCKACGQPRPYPTRPGMWAYRCKPDAPRCPAEVVDVNGVLHVKLKSGETGPLSTFEDYTWWRKVKVYQGTQSETTSTVTIDGLPFESASGLRWGKQMTQGPGFALALLQDAVGGPYASMFAHQFAEDILAHLKPRWEFTSQDVQEWVDFRCAIDAIAQQAISNPAGTLSAPSTSRLSQNPNFCLDDRRKGMAGTISA